jgi:hypothetical protein
MIREKPIEFVLFLNSCFQDGQQLNSDRGPETIGIKLEGCGVFLAFLS